MASQFGYCPNCGTALTAAGQVFCSGCGHSLEASAAAPTMPAATAPLQTMAAPPAAIPTAPPVPTSLAESAGPSAAPEPPGWAGAVASVPPDVPGWGAVAPGTIATVPRAGTSPLVLAGAALLLAAAVGVGVYLAFFNGNGNGGGGGGINFQPSTYSCAKGGSLTMTMTLPSSMNGSDVITEETDGDKGQSETVTAAGFKKQSNGSWVSSTTLDSDTMELVCSYGGAGFGPGKHTFRTLDKNGKVLAQGTLTMQE